MREFCTGEKCIIKKVALGDLVVNGGRGAIKQGFTVICINSILSSSHISSFMSHLK